MVTKLKYIIKEELMKKHNLSSKPKIKIGHGGTLDPLAEGVLVIGVGSGTKLLNEYLAGSKGYRAVALLGHRLDRRSSFRMITIPFCLLY